MKKLLVSDYDMTLRFRGQNLSKVELENIRSIARFINNGNVFAIASSRQFLSLSEEIEKNGFPTNYICCANANAIFNHNGELMFLNDLSVEEMRQINIILNGKYDAKLLDVYGKESYDYGLSYHIITRTNLDAEQLFVSVFQENGYGVDYFQNEGYVFSGLKQKDSAVEFIRLREGIKPDDVFTIGDGINDIPMLLNYNGYTFSWGEGTKSASLGQVDSVSNFIDLIESDKVLKRTYRKW